MEIRFIDLKFKFLSQILIANIDKIINSKRVSFTIEISYYFFYESNNALRHFINRINNNYQIKSFNQKSIVAKKEKKILK